MRSAFMLSTMYLKPWPSTPIRFSAGTSRLSKNTSQVLWFSMASILLISTPLPLASRRSTRNTDNPSDRLRTLSAGVVRASSSIRSECSTRRRPHLLAIHDVAVVALLVGPRLELRRIRARGRLGHAERLQPQLARGDARQILLLLRLVAVPQHRAHRVHLRMARRGIARAVVDRLQHGAGGADRQSRAAVLLRNQRAEIAGLRQRGDELGRIRRLVIVLHPIGIGKPLADARHALANVLPAGIDGDGDGFGFAAHARPILISTYPGSCRRVPLPLAGRGIGVSNGCVACVPPPGASRHPPRKGEGKVRRRKDNRNHHRPLYFGLRFSLKALMPSWRSSVTTVRL